MAKDGKGSLVGIDLGTTMSAISHIDSMGNAVTVANRDGDPLTPSAVYIDGENAIVGNAAKAAAAHNPGQVATFIKRSMGDPLYGRIVDGRQFRPETLSAILLKKLKQDTERRIGKIGAAVITVPAFFDDTRRKATADAGRIAGLEVLDIINEPTAAAIAYCLEGRLKGDDPSEELNFTNKEIKALVYDLGGGTFDVTLVKLGDKKFDTIATDGEVQLGGGDWDDTIVDYLGKLFDEQHGTNPAQDAFAGANWRHSVSGLAESTKKLLSQLTSAPLECFHKDQIMRANLTREQFEQMSRDLLMRTQVVTSFVVRDQAGMDWSDIDRVLLVGGSTRMPMVRKMLEKVTGKVPDDTLDPDQAVAHGAAIYAAVRVAQDEIGGLELDPLVADSLDEVEIRDVNSHSLGIEAFDRKMKTQVSSVLIPKNSSLPYAASRVFYTNKPGTKRVTVKVLEGEAPEASANILIGECRVTELPANLPTKAPIQVRLSYGANGRVAVMALDMTGGTLAEVNIKRSDGLTEAEIEKEAEFVDSLKIQ